MKKCLPLSLLLIGMNSNSESYFESQNYSSESSSEQEMVNGKPVKSKKASKCAYKEQGGKNGKILHEEAIEDQDSSDQDPSFGVESGGDDYFNFVSTDFGSKADEKSYRKSDVIRLISGYCESTRVGSCFESTGYITLKKNSAKTGQGDFFFGVFNSENNELSKIFAEAIEGSVLDNRTEAISIDEKFTVGLELINLFAQEELDYSGSLDASMGFLYGTRTKSKLCLCTVGNAQCAIGLGKKINLMPIDEPTKKGFQIKIYDITKGNVLFFATSSFWEKVSPDEAMRKASINFTKRRGKASATKVAEDLVKLAHQRGATEEVELLVVYIL